MAEPFLSEIRIMSIFGFAPRGGRCATDSCCPSIRTRRCSHCWARPSAAMAARHFRIAGSAGAHADSRRRGLRARRAGRRTGAHARQFRTAAAHPCSPGIVCSRRLREPAIRNHRLRPGSGSGQRIASATPTTALNAGSVANAGGSQAHVNMQPFLTLIFAIALQEFSRRRPKEKTRWHNPTSERSACSPVTSRQPAGCSAKVSSCRFPSTRLFSILIGTDLRR